jgi:hypothetical protein
MNGNRKWHKPWGPAFRTGERWLGVSGSIRGPVIIGCRKWGPNKWDWEITYMQADGSICEKNAWSFQVRYTHVADLDLCRRKSRRLRTKS